MATSYQDIIDALDAAILAGADEPINITIRGRTYTYRTLEELTKARSYYANLLRTQSGTVGVQFHRFKPGSIIPNA